MDSVIKERFLVQASKLCRVFIGVVFLVAGLSKMAEPFAFSAQVSTLTKSLIGDDFNAIIPTLLAFILPPLEAFLGIALILDWKSKLMMSLAGGLLVCFFGFLLLLHLGGVSYDCGCFGRLLRRSPKEALFEDAIMLCFVFLGFSATKDEKREDSFKWKGCMVTGVGIGALVMNGAQLLR